jgi:O-antigen/teichoic acid export membrane protein
LNRPEEETGIGSHDSSAVADESKAMSDTKSYDAHVGHIARGASITSFGVAVKGVMRFVIQFSLARMYGPTQLGFYVLGATVFAVASTLGQFGMDQSVVRHVAEYRAQNDTPRVRGTVLLALLASLALSLVLAASMYFGAGLLADRVFNKPFLEVVFKAFAVGVPFTVVSSTALVSTQGLKTMKPTSYVQQILQPLINFVLIVGFYLLGMQILGAIAATVLSTVIGCVLAFYYLRRMFPTLLGADTPPVFEGRKLFSVSVPMGIVNLTRSASAWGAVAVVGILSTAQEVGLYNVAARMGGVCAMGLVAFSGIFNPIISDLYSRNVLDDLGALYQDVCRWITVIGLAPFLLTVLLAKDFMAVFGSGFVAGWPVLVLIAIAQMFSSSVGPTNRILAMTGRQKTFMITILCSTAFSLAGTVPLVYFYGAVGAAVATAAGLVVFNLASVLFVRRLLGVWPYNIKYLKPVAAGGLSAAVVLLARLVFTPPEGVLAILVFSPLFLLSDVAANLTFGLDVNDRRFLQSAWVAASRRIGRVF